MMGNKGSDGPGEDRTKLGLAIEQDLREAIDYARAEAADRRRVHAIDEMPETERAALIEALEALAADEGTDERS